jgi:hypothetical protein
LAEPALFSSFQGDFLTVLESLRLIRVMRLEKLDFKKAALPTLAS